MSTELSRREPTGVARVAHGRTLARIDRAAEIAKYESDRIAEVVDHKRQNLDWATAGRIHGAELLGMVADHVALKRPSVAWMVERALVDREQTLSPLFRELGR